MKTLCILLATAACIARLAAANALHLGFMEGASGSVIEIPVYRTGGDPVGGASADLRFDPARIEFVSAGLGSAAAGWALDSEQTVATEVRLLLTHPTGAALPSGEVARVKVRLLETFTHSEATGTSLIRRETTSPAAQLGTALWLPWLEITAPAANAAVSNTTTGTVAFHLTPGEHPIVSLALQLEGGTVLTAANPAVRSFNWRPGLSAGGRLNLAVAATDDQSQVSTSPNVPVVINTPPVLAAIGNKSVNEHATLGFTAAAADPDLPANTLVFSLPAAPAGAVIHSTTGAFSWPLGATQVPGTYPVTVRVSDGELWDEETITVTVLDITPPVLNLPSDIVAEATGPSGKAVTFAVSATDLVSGTVAATATPPSGSTFPLGLTTVSVSATDAAGNTQVGSFKVTVRDTTAPVLNLPSDIIAEATGAGGAAVTFTVSGNDLVSGTVAATATPPSGSTFPLGLTTVSVSATDAAGNPRTGSFKVTVRDTTAPVLNLPSDIVAEATGAGGAAVTFTVSGTDLVSGTVAATATPPSGSTFPLGLTTVSVSATDAAGNPRTGSFKVTVRDTTAPVLNLPSDIVAEATGAGGAAVTFTVSGTDLVSGTVAATATPPSGSTFPLGLTTVSVSATDAAGNPRTGSFKVTVRDTTAPVLNLPADRVVTVSGSSGIAVSFTASATDLVDAVVAVAATPASGSVFAVGTTTVNVTATDAAGNTANGSFKVTVVNLAVLLRNVTITPASSTTMAGISGQIQGGPPNGVVVMQASGDLGRADPWEDIGSIQLDAVGRATFGPIMDSHSIGLRRNYYRVKLP